MFSGIQNVNCKLFRLHYQHCTSPSDCTWNSLEWWKQNVLSWTWTFFPCQLKEITQVIVCINKQILLSLQQKKLEGEKEKSKTEMDFINSATIVQVLQNPENEIQIKSMYPTHLDEVQRELHEKVFTIFTKYHWHLWKYLQKHVDMVLYPQARCILTRKYQGTPCGSP